MCVYVCIVEYKRVCVCSWMGVHVTTPWHTQRPLRLGLYVQIDTWIDRWIHIHPCGGGWI